MKPPKPSASTSPPSGDEGKSTASDDIPSCIVQRHRNVTLQNARRSQLLLENHPDFTPPMRHLVRIVVSQVLTCSACAKNFSSASAGCSSSSSSSAGCALPLFTSIAPTSTTASAKTGGASITASAWSPTS